ncbi:MAG: lipocalin-like domain-containing protein [Pseudomonadales bacterium]
MKWPDLPGRLSLLCALALIAVFGCSGPETVDSQSEKAPPGGGVRLQAVLGDAQIAADFARASPEVRLQFPQDHGPHPQFRSEWWYLTLMLEDSQGNEYGGQFTLFRQALAAGREARADNPWDAAQVYLAHLAATDVAGGRHRFAERISRSHPELAGVLAQPFAAWLENWRLASRGAAFLPLTLHAAADSFAWDLALDSTRPLVQQGHSGYSAKGPGQGSHYYSLTRLQAQGKLSLDGRAVAVHGSGWLDREWSTSVLSAGQQGWDWFALQLRDGRDLMMFRLRRDDCDRDPYDHGVLVDAEGRSQRLDAEQFTLTPLREWRGPEHAALVPVAGCKVAADASRSPGHGPWPLEWQLQLGNEQFRIRAALLDQRMRTSVQYWEGLVHVYDAAGETQLGRGYMELTGY